MRALLIGLDGNGISAVFSRRPRSCPTRLRVARWTERQQRLAKLAREHRAAGWHWRAYRCEAMALAAHCYAWGGLSEATRTALAEARHYRDLEQRDLAWMAAAAMRDGVPAHV